MSSIEDILEFNDLLHAVSRNARKVCDRRLAKAGCELQYLQFVLLVHVRSMEGKPGLSVKTVGEAMNLDRTTFYRNAMLLVNKGLLTKSESGYDDRAKVFYLTDAGRQFLDKNMQHLNNCSKHIANLSVLIDYKWMLKDLLEALENNP